MQLLCQTYSLYQSIESSSSLGYIDGGSFSWSPSYGNYSASFSGYSLPVNDGKLSVINGWSTSPGGAWSGSVTLYGLEIGGGGGGASTTSAAVVPEPASCVLVVTGLAMATVMKRFRSWRTKRSVATTAIQPLSDT